MPRYPSARPETLRMVVAGRPKPRHVSVGAAVAMCGGARNNVATSCRSLSSAGARQSRRKWGAGRVTLPLGRLVVAAAGPPCPRANRRSTFARCDVYLSGVTLGGAAAATSAQPRRVVITAARETLNHDVFRDRPWQHATSLGRVMPPCAPHGDLTDEALWTVTCPACRVDGMPQPNRWSARTPLRKRGRPGR